MMKILKTVAKIGIIALCIAAVALVILKKRSAENDG